MCVCACMMWYYITYFVLIPENMYIHLIANIGSTCFSILYTMHVNNRLSPFREGAILEHNDLECMYMFNKSLEN